MHVLERSMAANGKPKKLRADQPIRPAPSGFVSFESTAGLFLTWIIPARDEPAVSWLWRQRIQAFSAKLASLDLQADDDPVGVRDELVAQSHHVWGAKIGCVGGLGPGRSYVGRHEQTYHQPDRGTEPRRGPHPR